MRKKPRASRGALVTRSYYIDDPGDLTISLQGSIRTIGCHTETGEVVEIEMSAEIWKLVVEFFEEGE